MFLERILSLANGGKLIDRVNRPVIFTRKEPLSPCYGATTGTGHRTKGPSKLPFSFQLEDSRRITESGHRLET